MGNINSDFQSPGDTNLLLLLVRYWSTLIDTADNFSTISKSRKPLRTPSIASSADSRLSRKLRRRQPVTKRPEKIVENDDFDWQTTTKEELQALKSSVPWKDFETLNFGPIKSPKMRRKFRKRRKNVEVSKDMWTMSEKSYKSDDESYEKVFYKTSKMTMPDAQTNMLWRSFKDIETQSCSSLFSQDYLKISEIAQLKDIGNIETQGRKTRLSKWAFLRQESSVRSAGSLNRDISFRSRKPVVRKLIVSSSVGRRTSIRRRSGRHLLVPGKGWVLFKNRRRSWEKNSRDIEEESENGGSCCSCERCDHRQKR